MIGFIEGQVRAVIRSTLIVMAGSVGYRVHVPAGLLATVKDGDQISLWTHLAVRENSQDLYGFETKEGLSWFELLLSVSGIGPKSALSILSSADAKVLEEAIRRDDPSSLSRSFGIGKKTAEKIVLELREKVGTALEGEATGSDDDTDIIEALLSLGYSAKEARDTLQAVPRDIKTPEERLRLAIRLAANGK